MTHVKTYLTSEHQFIACPIVWYETKRGLLYKDAKKQLKQFERLFSEFEWSDFSTEDWNLSAQLWRDRHKAGRPMKDDHDLFIAAFTRNRNAVLVTNNAKDYELMGVTVVDWSEK